MRYSKVDNLLCKLELDKYNWLNRALSIYSESFVRYKTEKAIEPRVLVGIYGPTQVGKTSLILTLLGVGDDKFAAISNALRGGRTKGDSSTITSCIYKQSEDNEFHIFITQEEKVSCSSLDELEQTMKRLRDEIEAGTAFYENPIIIEIAKQYISHMKFLEESRNLSIIDLPGDDSKNEREEAYIQNVLNKYLPLCNVKIIMELSTQIVNLFQMDSPIIKEWMEFPTHFRLVLTRSMSPRSVRKKIEKNKIATLADFQDHYLTELQRSGMNIQTTIYPLEFGDSMLAMKKRNDSVLEKGGRWIQTLFTQLASDLSSMHTPENQILQMKSIEKSIQNQKKMEVDRLTEQINHLRLVSIDLKEHIAIQNRIYNYLITQKDRLQNQTKEIDQLQPEPFTFKDDIELINPEFLLSLSKKERFKSLYFLMRTCELRMEEHYNLELLHWKNKIKSIIKELDFKINLYFEEKLLVNNKLEITNKTRGTEIEQYLTYKNNSLIELYCEHISKVNKKVLTRLKKESEIKDSLSNYVLKNIHNNKLKAEEKEAQVIGIELELDIVLAEWDLDLKRADNLNAVLKQEAIREHNMMMSKILSKSSTPSEKWLYHHNVIRLMKLAERVVGNEYIKY